MLWGKINWEKNWELEKKTSKKTQLKPMLQWKKGGKDCKWTGGNQCVNVARTEKKKKNQNQAQQQQITVKKTTTKTRKKPTTTIATTTTTTPTTTTTKQPRTDKTKEDGFGLVEEFARLGEEEIEAPTWTLGLGRRRPEMAMWQMAQLKLQILDLASKTRSDNWISSKGGKSHQQQNQQDGPGLVVNVDKFVKVVQSQLMQSTCSYSQWAFQIKVFGGENPPLKKRKEKEKSVLSLEEFLGCISVPSLFTISVMYPDS